MGGCPLLIAGLALARCGWHPGRWSRSWNDNRSVGVLSQERGDSRGVSGEVQRAQAEAAGGGRQLGSRRASITVSELCCCWADHRCRQA